MRWYTDSNWSEQEGTCPWGVDNDNKTYVRDEKYEHIEEIDSVDGNGKTSVDSFCSSASSWCPSDSSWGDSDDSYQIPRRNFTMQNTSIEIEPSAEALANNVREQQSRL